MRNTVDRLGLLAAVVTILIVLAISPSGAVVPAAGAGAERPTGAVEQGAVAVNPVINFQGRLLDPATGQAKRDGTYAMTFRLYSLAQGGAALWAETKNVSLTRGLFNTLLGDTTALPVAIFDGQTLFLGIQFGSDAESTPRQRLGYGAYAFYALDAGSLGGQTATAFALASHTHTGSDIVDGSITANDLAASLPKAKFISLDLFGAYLLGGAMLSNGSGADVGLILPPNADGAFYLGFTVPPDYTTGSAISVDIVWHIASTNCTIQFAPSAMSVARPGRTNIMGPNPESGITVVGGTLLQAPATSGQSSRQVVTLAAPDGVTPLQAGDAITFSLSRNGTHVDDNCASAQVVQGFLVHYD